MRRFGHTNKFGLSAGFELEEGAGLLFHCRFALTVSLAVLLLGCEDVEAPSRGAKGVCEALRNQGVSTEDARRDGGYACRTTASSAKPEWRDITVTAYAPPTNENGLEGVLMEGWYRRGGQSQTVKHEMTLASATVFSRLNMDVPPGLALAIQTRSQSEVEAGRLRVSVDHGCPASEIDPCRIRIHIRNSGFVPVLRRRRM
jgi:hypothetical protein